MNIFSAHMLILPTENDEHISLTQEATGYFTITDHWTDPNDARRSSIRQVELSEDLAVEIANAILRVAEPVVEEETAGHAARNLAYSAIAVAAGLAPLMVWAQALHVAWGWFVTPWLFISPPSIWVAAGLFYIFTMIAHGLILALPKQEPIFEGASYAQTLWPSTLKSLICALLVWGFSWVVAAIGGLL